MISANVFPEKIAAVVTTDSKLQAKTLCNKQVLSMGYTNSEIPSHDHIGPTIILQAVHNRLIVSMFNYSSEWLVLNKSEKQVLVKI